MNAIVWGTNHNNALGLVWSLGEAGHDVYLILLRSDINYVDKSKYVKQCIYIDSYEYKTVIEAVKRVVKLLLGKPILFSTDDDGASLINENYNEFSKYCLVGGIEGNHELNKYISKSKMNELAMSFGLNIPQTWIVDSPDYIPVDMTFPVFVKAENSIRGGKSVIHICKSQDDLLLVLKSFNIDIFPILIQEYINKTNEILLLGCSLYQGEVFCSIGLNKIRQSSGYGATVFANSFLADNDSMYNAILTKINRMIRHVGYVGLFSAEFIISDNKEYFLEINFRNDGTSYLSTKCGCNLPDLFCKSFLSNSVSQFDYHPHYYMNLTLDMINVVKRKIGFIRWIKDFNRTDCFSHFNKNDIKPYLYHLLSVIYSKIK